MVSLLDKRGGMVLGGDGAAKARGCVWLTSRVSKVGPSILVGTRSTCADLVGNQQASGCIHRIVAERGTMCSGAMALQAVTRPVSMR